MEYSPGNAIPYVSRVDAGNDRDRAAVRRDVVSSGDLAQRFEAVWTDAALATHLAAAERLYRIKDRAFDLIRQRMVAGAPLTRDRSPGSDGRVVRARRAWSPTRHRTSRRRRTRATRTIRPLGPCTGRFVPTKACSSISGVSCRHRVRSLPTSPGWASPARASPEDFSAAFAAARDGRDAAVDLGAVGGARRPRAPWVRSRSRLPRRWSSAPGSGAQFIHRTGHSLGEERARQRRPHGRLRDARRPPAAAGTGFTIEPGVYTDRYGVRTEINMFVGEREARVTGPLQQEIVTLN